MKILLVYPPRSPKVLAPSNFEPLALEILASIVSDHEVKIIDLRFESFSMLTPFLSSFTPDVVGITVNNTIHVNQALEVLKFIRLNNPDGINIVGGHHPSLTPQDFYTEYVDAIFLGWAEKSFPQYVKSIATNGPLDSIPGVVILRNGIHISQNSNFYDLDPDDIPFPDRSLPQKYRKRYRDELGRRTALVNTARGCPYRCSFCACWKAAGGNYLVRSAEDVFKEIISLPSDIGRVFFADDNTFFDINRAEDLYGLIKKSRIKKKYSGYCRSDTIVKYPDLFHRWKEIGLDNLAIGFESTDNNILKKLNKANYIEINQKAVRILRDINLKFRSYFLIDPDYEEKDFHEILDYVKQFNIIRPMFTILTPLPGTQLYEEKKSRINMSYDYFDFMHWVFPTKMKAKKFYKSFVGLYYKAYSFRRHIKILLRNYFNRIKRYRSGEKQIQCISLKDLILLKIVAYPLWRKLYRQYFGPLKNGGFLTRISNH